MSTTPSPDAAVTPPVSPAPLTAEEDDELFPHCVQFAALHPDLDAAMLCNAFSIGRKRAKKLMKGVQSTRLRQGYAVASNVQHTQRCAGEKISVGKLPFKELLSGVGDMIKEDMR